MTGGRHLSAGQRHGRRASHPGGSGAAPRQMRGRERDRPTPSRAQATHEAEPLQTASRGGRRLCTVEANAEGRIEARTKGSRAVGGTVSGAFNEGRARGAAREKKGSAAACRRRVAAPQRSRLWA